MQSESNSGEMDESSESKEAVVDALTTLMALQRDQLLGYRESELHTDPKQALQQALEALSDAGENPGQVIWADDREKLGLKLPSDAETEQEDDSR